MSCPRAGIVSSAVEIENMERDDVSGAERAVLLKAVMRSQAALSLRIASVFLGLILALPLINYFLPDVAAFNIGGFTLSWLILGVLFYPITWVLSKWFILASNKIETDLVTTHSKNNRQGDV